MTPVSTTQIDFREPFTRAQALAASISPAMLRGPRFRRLFRGVYIHQAARTGRLVRVRGALLLHPGSAFASHASAARVYRLPTPKIAEEHVSVTCAADRRNHDGVVDHVVCADTPVRVVDGVRVSEPTRLFVELASLLGLVDLVVAGDALIRLNLATLDDLREACARARGRGSREARCAVKYVRTHVDSPMETRLRMLLVLAGLPEPRVNYTIYTRAGQVRYRLDLSYPELKLVIEYDGRQHREDLDQWDHDIVRREWFDQNGWMIVQVVARGIYQRPDETINRVRAALQARGCTTLPRSFQETWRAYFPVKA